MIKKAFCNQVIFIGLLAGTFSCEQAPPPSSTLDRENLKNRVSANFQGEEVYVESDFPISFLGQTIEEFQHYYDSLTTLPTMRLAQEGLLTTDALSEIINQNINNYPRVNYDQDISEVDLAQIFKDIPSINTKEEAIEKIPIIFDFYHTLLRKDVLEDAMQIMATGTSTGRVLDLSPEALSKPERTVLLLNPVYANSYIKAAKDAQALTKQHFTDWEDPIGLGNSFQHSVWNGLIIRYILGDAPASEDTAIDFAQRGTSAHEKDDEGKLLKDNSAAMDLHNNQAARRWMADEVKWGIGFLRKMPSAEEIINYCRDAANNSTLSTRESILTARGGDNDNTWNVLYNDRFWGDKKLVRLQ